ncbi:hypothetical protein EDB89DRAFT_1912519 [Lactarius sanguifluus]|nr:hypothetical protein EDB89DRAFT_1912519 [Lactarius sanguifluus]
MAARKKKPWTGAAWTLVQPWATGPPYRVLVHLAVYGSVTKSTWRRWGYLMNAVGTRHFGNSVVRISEPRDPAAGRILELPCLVITSQINQREIQGEIWSLDLSLEMHLVHQIVTGGRPFQSKSKR